MVPEAEAVAVEAPLQQTQTDSAPFVAALPAGVEYCCASYDPFLDYDRHHPHPVDHVLACGDA